MKAIHIQIEQELKVFLSNDASSLDLEGVRVATVLFHASTTELAPSAACADI